MTNPVISATGLWTPPHSISNAELKGLLNRATDKTWGWEYARIFTPREFLEELKLAIENYLRRHGDVR